MLISIHGMDNRVSFSGKKINIFPYQFLFLLELSVLYNFPNNIYIYIFTINILWQIIICFTFILILQYWWRKLWDFSLSIYTITQNLRDIERIYKCRLDHLSVGLTLSYLNLINCSIKQKAMKYAETDL